MAELLPIFVLFAASLSFLLSPVIALIIGFVRVSKYNDARYSLAINPDSYTDEDMKDFKKSIIAAFVTALILAIIVISVVILFRDDIMYM